MENKILSPEEWLNKNREENDWNYGELNETLWTENVFKYMEAYADEKYQWTSVKLNDDGKNNRTNNRRDKQAPKF